MAEEHAEVQYDDIQAAKQRLGERVVQTPLIYAPNLSERAGVDVYLKCENLQRTGSFKVRGALNMLLAMTEQTRPTAVVTASSGNHGQAVAYAANALGIPCTVVVPETVIAVKEQAIRKYGAAVVRCGTMSSERIAFAERFAEEHGAVFVPPYDHAWIVAGQGTTGLEILDQRPDVSVVCVPVGGGGLISGIATAVKHARPETKVIGVEPELANDTYLSLQQGKRVDIGETKTIADGLRTSHPGHLTFPIVQRCVDEIWLAPESGIARASAMLLQSNKLLAEPSGATSIAGLLAATDAGTRLSGPVVCVISGGNADTAFLRQILS